MSQPETPPSLRRDDAAALAGAQRASLYFLERHALAFARYGFDDRDLFGMSWPPNNRLALRRDGVAFSRSAEHVDTTWRFKPPVDQTSTMPWDPPPRHRLAVSVGPYTFGLRPVSGEGVLRRFVPHEGMQDTEELIIVTPAQVQDLSAFIESRIG